jgi:hypothetical protein
VSLVQYSLTQDDALRLSTPPALGHLVARWLPFHAVPCDVGAAGITIEVVAPGVLQLPASLPEVTLRMGETHCRVDGDVAWLDGPGVRARIDLAGAHATVELDPAAPAVDVVPALTLPTAMLLARSRRYLLHCGAVEHPAGGVWLLAGDSRAGKTSTCLALARAGWGLLADDHVVLRPVEDGWEVEGWPRLLHPDEGWREGVPTGRRIDLDPRSAPGVRMARPGRLAGVLLPVVEGGPATTVAPARHSDALSMLLRQTAWSVADRGVAARTLADLSAATAVRTLALRLGLDTFGDPALLEARLDSVL